MPTQRRPVDRQRAFEDIFQRPTASHAPRPTPHPQAFPPAAAAPGSTYAGGYVNAYGPPPLPVMQQQRPQPRPQSTYYGGDGFVPQQPGYPPPLPPGAPRYYFDPRHGSPSQFPQYQQQQSAIYSPSNYAPSPQLQQSPYAPSSASMSPNPAQMATDYIFQQQQALQQSQSSSAMSHQTYSQDVASPTDHLSDHSSGKVDSPAATSSLSDLTRDPHLSAFMVKPTEGDASTSTAEIAGDEYPVYAQGRRQSDGSSMFEGFSQVNPSIASAYADSDVYSGHHGRASTPGLAHRDSVESDHFSGMMVHPPSGPRPLPQSGPSGYANYRQSMASSTTSTRPQSVYGEEAPLLGSASPYGQSNFSRSQPQLPPGSMDTHASTPPPPLPSNMPSQVRSRSSIHNFKTERTLSMTSLTPSMVAQQRPQAQTTVTTHSRRSPIVYPALLSRVAEAFKARVLLTEHVKDGLVYKDTFDGREAVDKICYIIKTTDRNLGLLLGRALDSQKYFHDVAWEHRLRDSPNEIYQFRERMAFVATDGVHEAALLDRQQSSVSVTSTLDGYLPSELSSKMLLDDPQRPGQQIEQSPQQILQQQAQASETQNPSGIFTLLTDCYSPTCSRDRLCYSIACPRRLEQQARLKLKPQPGLKRSDSTVSVGDLKEPGTLWVHKVPQDVVDSVDKRERDRQEAINEIVYTEKDFLRDIEYLRDVWIKGIREGTAIPDDRKEDFITQVFWNILELHSVSQRLAEALHQRQKAAHVVHDIGDVLMDHAVNFQPFVQYGSHQIFGKYEFEREKGSNPAFAAFVEECERLPESRKLELNGYLTKPTTRLARYPLLLEAVLKKTADDNPDQMNIPKAVKIVREFLSKLNAESGRSENRFNLAQLDTQLVFRPGDAVDLRLREETRELITKGPLKKRGGTQSESAELQVFLFDHAILMTKPKNKNEQYKVFRKPIPLELLIVTVIEENGTTSRIGSGRARNLVTRHSSNGRPSGSTLPTPAQQNNKNGYAMVFTHLGRKGYDITLWTSTWVSRKNWLEKIEAKQLELRERSLVFDSTVLSEGMFSGSNRVTCAAPYDAGQRLVFGTDSGVWLADLNNPRKLPVRVINVANVTQVEVLDDHGLLIVLADKAVQTFFVDSLNPRDAEGAAKRSRKITSNTSFFKSGICMGRTLVCVVKSSSASSTIKALEPTDQDRSRKQPGLRKLLGSHEHLRVYKEFYLPIPTDSVHFLKSKLCVGCPRGFEIVDLQSLNTQGLLDPADPSLDFVQKRENVRPLAIYRIDSDFLLCYDEFAFYVNKNGWRSKGSWNILWEGRPTHFAMHYPFVLAFEPTFIEVRHVDTGALVQIIPGSRLKCLYDDSPVSSSSASHFSSYGGQAGYPMRPGQTPRQSMYGVPQAAASMQHMRMSQRPSQILFIDNGHQILRIQPASPL